MKDIEWFFDHPQSENGMQGFMSFCRYVVMGVFKVCFRQRNIGADVIDRLPEGKACIIVGNHTSNADPLFMWFGIMPHLLRFIGKKELFGSGFGSRYMAWAGVIPIDRTGVDRKAIKRAIRTLKNGEILGVFPEGKRIRKPGQVSEPETGTASLAMMADVPIVPCGIEGADRIRPYGKPFLRFPRVTVRFGEPVDWHAFEILPRYARSQAITDEVMRRVNALKTGVDAGPMPDLNERYADILSEDRKKTDANPAACAPASDAGSENQIEGA